MENGSRPALCKSVFKTNESREDISAAITLKWIELIEYLEKKLSDASPDAMKGDVNF